MITFFYLEIYLLIINKMKFCSKCDNMYYMKIVDDTNPDKLIYYCRNCGNEDHNLTQNNFKVYKYESETQIKTNPINEFTKYDPTLPHLTSIKCPNSNCPSNDEEKNINSDVLYVRYNNVNMSYMYLCCFCDTNWKS